MIPCSCCQANSARPASSRAGRSGRSACGSTWPCSTSRYIGVPCEISTPKTSCAGVGVGVEVDQPDRAAPRGDRADVRLGDRVVAAEDDRHRAGVDHLADVASIAACDAHGVGRDTGASPKSTTAQLRDGVDLPRGAAPAGTGGADRARPEARARAVGRGRPSAPRRPRRRRPRARPGPACTAAGEGQQPGVVGLLPWPRGHRSGGRSRSDVN